VNLQVELTLICVPGTLRRMEVTSHRLRPGSQRIIEGDPELLGKDSDSGGIPSEGLHQPKPRETRDTGKKGMDWFSHCLNREEMRISVSPLGSHVKPM